MKESFWLNLIWFEPFGIILFIGATISLIIGKKVSIIIGIILFLALVIREMIIYNDFKKFIKDAKTKNNKCNK